MSRMLRVLPQGQLFARSMSIMSRARQERAYLLKRARGLERIERHALRANANALLQRNKDRKTKEDHGFVRESLSSDVRRHLGLADSRLRSEPNGNLEGSYEAHMMPRDSLEFIARESKATLRRAIWSEMTKYGVDEEEFQAVISQFEKQNPRVPLQQAPPSATMAPFITESQISDARIKYGSLKFASVALVGAPNAGKSTLLNALVDSRVTAVSRKRNTTRRKVLGAITDADRQIMFFDTPGLFGTHTPEHLAMGWDAAVEAHECALVMDIAVTRTPKLKELSKLAKDLVHRRNDVDGKPTILILNKMDLADKTSSRYMDRVRHFTSLADFKAVFIVSALKNKGIRELKEYLLASAMPGEWILRPDVPSGDSMVDVVHDVIREEFFDRVHDELPYDTEFINEAWTELPNGVLRIDELLRVPAARHISIVYGQGCSKITAIRKASELRLTEVFRRPVQLVIQCKARSRS